MANTVLAIVPGVARLECLDQSAPYVFLKQPVQPKYKSVLIRGGRLAVEETPQGVMLVLRAEDCDSRTAHVMTLDTTESKALIFALLDINLS